MSAKSLPACHGAIRETRFVTLPPCLAMRVVMGLPMPNGEVEGPHRSARRRRGRRGRTIPSARDDTAAPHDPRQRLLGVIVTVIVANPLPPSPRAPHLGPCSD